MRKLLLVIYLTLFLLALLVTFAIVSKPLKYDYPFHLCYASKWDSRICSQEVYNTDSYEFYPPLTALVTHFFNMRLWAVLVVIALLVLLPIAGNSFFTPIYFLGVGYNWFSTGLNGGIIPFFLIMVYCVYSLAFWGKMRKRHKLLLVLIALFTHDLGGWWFALHAFVLESYGQKKGLPLLVVLALGSLVVSLIFYSTPALNDWEYRPVYLVLLYSSVLFGRLFNEFEAKRL